MNYDHLSKKELRDLHFRGMISLEELLDTTSKNYIKNVPANGRISQRKSHASFAESDYGCWNFFKPIN